MSDEIIVRIRAEGVDEFTKQVKKAGGVVEDTGDKAVKSNKKMSSSFSSLGKTIGAAFTVSAIIQFSKALAKLATDVDATNAKFKTVFGSAGKIVDDFAKTNARALGLTTSEFRKAASSIGDLLVPIGFQREEAAKLSSELVNLSGALASWDTQQRSSTEISEILTKALLGEREQLKTLGVSIEEADVKQRLLEKGQSKLTGTAEKQARVLATLELVTEKTGDAQASATDDTITLREQQLQLSAAFRQIAQDIAQDVIPAYSNLLTTLNGFFATQNEFERLREVARTGTFQEVQAEKERLQLFIDQFKAKKQTEGLSFQERVNLAQFENILKRVNKIEAERDFRADAAGRRGGATEEQRAAIAAAKAAEEAAAAEAKRIEEGKKQLELEKEQERQRKRLLAIIQNGVDEIRNGNLGLKETEEQIEEIAIALNDGLVTTFQDLKLDELITSDIEDAFARIGVAVADVDNETDNFWKNFAKEQKEAAELSVEIEKARQDAISGISRSGFDIAQNIFERQIQSVQAQADAEVISQEEAQRRISEIRTKQAKADKAQAIFSIGVDTARSIAKTLANVGLPAGIPLIAIAAALGAAQLATVISQPIPQFAEGTKGSKKAPKGFAWVGEEGPELVQMRGGEKVITAPDSEAIMKVLGGYGIPVQFKTSYDELYKPMTAMHKLVKDSPLEGIDWNPLLMSNETSRRSAGRKLDKIYMEMVRLNNGLTRKMTRA